jgi:hypothetical protein
MASLIELIVALIQTIAEAVWHLLHYSFVSKAKASWVATLVLAAIFVAIADATYSAGEGIWAVFFGGLAGIVIATKIVQTANR